VIKWENKYIYVYIYIYIYGARTATATNIGASKVPASKTPEL